MAKTRKINGVLIDPESRAGDCTLDGTLDGYYAALHCTCIDIVTRKIGDHNYAIVCDDEGLLKTDPIVTAIDKEYSPMLTGSLFICADDEDHPGELRSLNTQEKREVHAHLIYGISAKGQLHPVLRGVEYC